MSIKKLLLLTTAVLILANEIIAQVPKRYEVIGPVRSLRQETAKLTDIGGETIEGPRVVIQTATFDDHGRMTEQIMNNPDGTRKWQSTWNVRSTYDTNGREIERESYNDRGDVTSRTVWVYQTNGILTKSITYGTAGEIKFYTTFEYDESGHKIRADYFDAARSTQSNDVFVYDSRGYLAEVTHSEGVLQHRDTYKHDDRGNQTEWSVYDNTGHRELKVSSGYSDDSRGNPTEFLRYDSKDKVVSKEVYTYEFDSRGNWIKSKTRRELLTGPAPIIEKEVTYRTISYRQPD